jgi:AcrR family transcriptional regulator
LTPSKAVRTPKGSSAEETAEDKIESRERAIKEAALRCIRRHGVKKVAVEDIAIAAGVSRRTFYRFFTGRRAIMEAIVLDRLSAIADRLASVIQQCEDFESSVIVGTIETMRLVAADKIYMDIVSEDRSLQFDLQRSGPERPRETLFMKNWATVFDRAREDGVLRPTITNYEAEDWLMDIHRLLVLRDDLSDAEKAERLRKFVLPALVTTP